MPQVTVHKLDHTGKEVWRYSGRTLERRDDLWKLEAFFDRELDQVGHLELRRGDRFIETFYAHRWYNIFAVHDAEDGQLKGFYCNITRPPRFDDQGHIYAEDLALDLVVYPNGTWWVTDEEEFAALPLGLSERKQSLRALAELQSLASLRHGPFAALEGPRG
ncbi:MAG: DUF402 domain-containing protein [Chloroflexota bacterium]